MLGDLCAEGMYEHHQKAKHFVCVWFYQQYSYHFDDVGINTLSQCFKNTITRLLWFRCRLRLNIEITIQQIVARIIKKIAPAAYVKYPRCPLGIQLHVDALHWITRNRSIDFLLLLSC